MEPAPPPANRFAFPAMLAGSASLAFGPWLVRIADVAPMASAFWRLSLAVVPLLLLARFVSGREGTPAFGGLNLGSLGLAALAGVFFAIDLALWHLGILRTTLANATLLTNAATFLLPLWGFVVLRQRPGRPARAALLAAALGTALLLGRSADLSPRNFTGDLLCLGAALFYTAYLLTIEKMRSRLAAMPLLALATAFGAVTMLPLALLEPGAFWPGNWTPILVLAFGSQLFGQGLVVYAVGHLRPIVVGLALLIQPAISATVGALRFGEVPGVWELTGAGLVVAALLLVRLPDRAAP